MKKEFVFISVMLLVAFSQVLFSETFEIVVNKDTNFIDNMGEDIGKVSQGTVLTVNTENDEICHYFEDREGKDASLYLSELDKCIYMRDITVKNASDSLPEDIIGSVYTMSYYLKDILNDSTDNLFLNEPYLTEFWNEKDVVEGENFSEGYTPFSIKFYSNIFFKNYDTFTLYSWTPFFIENIKNENDGFYLKLFLLTPRNGYSPIFERINRPRKEGLYLKFQIDGDYLLVYKDGTLIFEFIKADKNMLTEIRSFYVNHEVDFSRITFPRHADGSCDYDDIATAAASTISNIEELESVNVPATEEHAESAEEAAESESSNKETSAPSTESPDAAAKQKAALPILPIAAGGVALAVLLAVVLLAAKKKESRQGMKGMADGEHFDM